MIVIKTSHGDLKVNSDTGVVLQSIPEYSKIKKFDIANSKNLSEEIDILNIGYWMADGTFEPPEELV